MGKMRYFRKRINRGIVLGALLLVAVILFTVISNSVFKNVESDRIKKLAENYISDYTVLFTDHLGKPLGTVPTAEETEHIASDFAEFADKYFAYKKKASMSGLDSGAKNVEDIEREYRDNVVPRIGRCQIDSMSLSYAGPWDRIKVKKAGPKNAVVSVDMSGSVKLSGDPSGLYFPGAYAYAQSIGEFIIDENGNLIPVAPPAAEDSVREGSCSVNTSLFFEKVNGEWKIVYVSYAYLNVDVAESERGAYSK